MIRILLAALALLAAPVLALAQPTTQPRENLVLAPNVRGDNALRLHPDILEGGWTLYIDRHVEPDLAWMEQQGFKGRVLIHMPYGVLPGPYQLDMRQEAERRGLASNDFVRAWRKVADRAEVIFYVGQVQHDTDFDRYWTRETGWIRYRSDNWVARFTHATRQLVDAGGSIAFDASHDWPADSVQYAAMLLARRQCEANGAAAYIEPRQTAEAEHFHSWRVISTEQFWPRSDPDQHPDSAWAARTEQLTGEILRWPQTPTGGWGGPAREVAERLAADVHRIHAAGHTAIVAAGVLRKQGVGL